MNAHRLVFSALAAVLGVLAFASAPALAAAPEVSEVTVESPVPATSATVSGVLNAAATGPVEAGSYEFLYAKGNAGCTGGSTAPVPPGLMMGVEDQSVSQVLSGLSADTEYTVCLRAVNDASEEIVGPEASFVTGDAQPMVVSESVESVETSGATLVAEIDPDGVETTYHFVYGSGESYGQSTAESASIGADGLDHKVTVRISGLQPGTVYHYRVVASNSLSPAGGTTGRDKTFTTPLPQGSGTAQSCANERLRSEQAYGLGLPDCRAYEMVSPVEKDGNDATDVGQTKAASRAAVSGEAIVFTSHGSFADPAGAQYENQFLSRRGPQGWSTQSITPPFNIYNAAINESPYENMVFTPELSKGVANTDASLKTNEASEAPAGQFALYESDFADSSYRWLSKAPFGPEENDQPYTSSIRISGSVYEPMGASTDLSHVVFGDLGYDYTQYEWINGEVVAVGVNNNGELLPYSSTGYDYESPRHNTGGGLRNADTWNAVSSDGSRVFFTSSDNQLYLREDTEKPQSPLASPEEEGSGTLASGSRIVTSLLAATGATHFLEGATEITLYPGSAKGKFVAGQQISGEGIAAGTTITKVTTDTGPLELPSATLTLSAPTTAATYFYNEGEAISSEGPAPFAVDEQIAGRGIPLGTTISAVAPGALTLSAPSTVSAGAVVLNAGGRCTVSTDACTVQVSASQRAISDPNGPQGARYWGASTDGSRVFFTSSEELTEDAYTGPSDNAANLYEYNVESGKLNDLTIDKTDTDGAAVQGVMQVSEDGSYVYFVADGVLAPGAKAGAPNLYVAHDGGTPTFIATIPGERYVEENTWGRFSFGHDYSAVSSGGSRLAFLSQQSLTGYDNERAEPGDCKEEAKCSEVYLYDASVGSLTCVSCNPTGARPTGPSSLGEGYDGAPEHRRRNFSEDGSRLFFQSADAVVPHSSDGRGNVYEYEDGHVYAISNVAGAFESFFLDASASGNDVFFATADQLLPEDQDNRIDVYDARVGGGFPVSNPLPSCDNGDSCKPPPASQPTVFGAPGSATFSGAGNLAPTYSSAPTRKVAKKTLKCKRPKKLSRGKCVKSKKSGKAKRVGNERRTKS